MEGMHMIYLFAQDAPDGPYNSLACLEEDEGTYGIPHYMGDEYERYDRTDFEPKQDASPQDRAVVQMEPPIPRIKPARSTNSVAC